MRGTDANAPSDSWLNERSMMKKILSMLFALFAVVLLGCEPQYNHDRPDTEPNRAGFQKHFGFPAPDSVSNLYYFADALGADVKYQLGFSADGAVI